MQRLNVRNRSRRQLWLCQKDLSGHFENQQRDSSNFAHNKRAKQKLILLKFDLNFAVYKFRRWLGRKKKNRIFRTSIKTGGDLRPKRFRESSNGGDRTHLNGYVGSFASFFACFLPWNFGLSSLRSLDTSHFLFGGFLHFFCLISLIWYIISITLFFFWEDCERQLFLLVFI